MKELMTGGSTVIYVSHDVKTLSKMCDRVIWLDKGKIKMMGEAKEICDSFIAQV